MLNIDQTIAKKAVHKAGQTIVTLDKVDSHGGDAHMRPPAANSMTSKYSKT